MPISDTTEEMLVDVYYSIQCVDRLKTQTAITEAKLQEVVLELERQGVSIGANTWNK
jgi:hypothetical protein